MSIRGKVENDLYSEITTTKFGYIITGGALMLLSIAGHIFLYADGIESVKDFIQKPGLLSIVTGIMFITGLLLIITAYIKTAKWVKRTDDDKKKWIIRKTEEIAGANEWKKFSSYAYTHMQDGIIDATFALKPIKYILSESRQKFLQYDCRQPIVRCGCGGRLQEKYSEGMLHVFCPQCGVVFKGSLTNLISHGATIFKDEIRQLQLKWDNNKDTRDIS